MAAAEGVAIPMGIKGARKYFIYFSLVHPKVIKKFVNLKKYLLIDTIDERKKIKSRTLIKKFHAIHSENIYFLFVFDLKN